LSFFRVPLTLFPTKKRWQWWTSSPDNTIGLVSGGPNSDDEYLQITHDLAAADDDPCILPIAGVGGPSNIRDVRYLRGIDIRLTQTNSLDSFAIPTSHRGASIGPDR
jgi:hypothetical protein